MTVIRELDISPEYCLLPSKEDLECVLRNGYRRIWVGASYSSFDVVEQYLQAIEAAGLMSGVYGFVHWDETAKAHIDNALRHVLVDRRRGFLLDIELGDPYSMDPAFVLGRVGWSVDYIRKAAVEPISYCVTSDTRVLTYDLRWIPAGELAAGDRLLSFEENRLDRGKRRPRRFQEAVVTGNRVKPAKVWEIQLSDGTSLRCTPEHRWLIKTSSGLSADASKKRLGWIRTEELPSILENPQRRNALTMPRFVRPWSIERDYEAGFLAAAFDGEGCLTRHKIGTWPHLSFVQKQNAFLEDVHAMLLSKGFQITREKVRTNGCTTLHVNGGRQGTLEFLGRFRPPRQLARWEASGKLEHELAALERVEIIAARPLPGLHEIAELSSSSGTYIAEGFGAHNTGPWWWGPATNDSQETFGTMAVVAEYVHDPDSPPPIEGVEPCGGWSAEKGNMYGWQYAGTVETCNLNTDRILVIKEADMAFDALKRATQDAALRQLAGDALNDNMASLVSRLVYFGVLTPGTTPLRPALVTETGS